MKTITFECETITPMFLSGADGKTPELRPPSIKGALRFWWRAMNGNKDLKTLKKEEVEIFGGSYKDENGKEVSKRSNVIIRIEAINIKNETNILIPHKKFMKQESIQTKSTFLLHVSLMQAKILLNKVEIFNIEQLKALFMLTSLLGGIGKRVRRGMGSFNIKNNNYTEISLEIILSYLNIINPNNFEIKEEKIVSKFYKGEQFPYIKQIEIGKPDSQLLEKISDATHETKDIDNRAYEISLGHAFRGRFASPVYISCVKSKFANLPIITTLNAVPNRDKHLLDIGLQNDFKAKIL